MIVIAYTITQASKRTGLTVHTLRFYEKEGLLPYVERDSAGNRIYQESDFRWLDLIICLKSSGMPIKKIKDYVLWSIEGDATLDIRLEMMRSHKNTILEKISELEKYIKQIDYKIEYYEASVRAGTESIHLCKKA